LGLMGALDPYQHKMMMGQVGKTFFFAFYICGLSFDTFSTFYYRA
jgi:hypothetical protein